ncbi:MAG: hypothetical protein KKH98_02780 [Spirochaetes bacterium]|nr:hypothetical protein [Spirochaetota bacterium]
MADCPSLQGCPFFNDKMANMPAVADMIKRKHCKDAFTECARYMVSKALGKEHVPLDLFPNQHERAVELIG